MLHTSIAMISFSAFSHINWGGMLVSLQSFAMHAMEAHATIFP